MANLKERMDFEEFITKVYNEEIKDIKELNELIKENFPDFSKKNKKYKNLFRLLVAENVAESEDLEQSLTLLNIIYKNLFSNISTLDNYFSKDIRKPIFTKFGRYSDKHLMSKDLAKLDSNEKEKLISDSEKSLRMKHNDHEEINPEEIFNIISEALQSEDVYKQFIGLLLCCGSRTIELVDKSTFEKIDDVWIKQLWIAKKKTDEQLELIKPIIYLNTDDFIKKLADVRYDIRASVRSFYNSRGDINSLVGTRVNRAFKSLFGEKPTWIPHSCRKIYAQISYKLYAKKSILGVNPSIQDWIGKVLGHDEKNMSASLNYSNFQIQTSNFNGVEIDEIKSKIKLLEDSSKNNDNTSKVIKSALELKSEQVDELNERIKLLEDSLKNNNNKVKKPSIELKLEQFDEILKQNYEPYMKLYKFEEKLKNKVPRAVIREWYHTKRAL